MQKVRIYLLLFSPAHDKIIKIQKIQFLLFILSLEHKFLKLSKGYKMNRRKFLTMSMATALALPAGALALDYRAEKPAAWTAKTVDAAIKALYGDVKLIESKDIMLKMPKVTTSGSQVPVTITTSIDAKTVSLFQNSNPESAVAVWTVPENGIIDYKLKLKIKTLESGSPSVVTVVVQGKDGALYTTHASVVVRGGCEG